MMLLRKYFGIFVCLYLQIVNISCDDGSTLAFAIDDTISMWDDIAYVKKGAKAIMNLVFAKKNSEIKNLVLVTINDPQVVLRTNTNSQSTFLKHLNSIKTHNMYNRDCEEMSLTGMETALTNSRQGSYIYVFTDANAKDFRKLNKIKSLCQKKQSQVVIVFSIALDCYRPSENMFTVYYDVARACSGQVFIVEKNQVDSVLKTIEILLQGKNSIFKWITVPRTSKYVPVKFTLDEKAEYAIVSTSGKNVYLKITTGNSFWSPEPVLRRTMWNGNGKVVKLVRPKPGTYIAWVKGDSTISVVVYGRTDFTFEHGFSVLQPKSMVDTAKQPIAGTTVVQIKAEVTQEKFLEILSVKICLKQHLSINVTDPDHSVNIQTVQILDIRNNDRVINTLPLRSIGKNFYITEPFVSPNYTFRIAVKGEIKKTHEPIIRHSRTNIDPSFVDWIPESKPVVKIDEGSKLDVNYGSAVTLTCKVSAHPAPKIEWYTSSGRLLPSQSSVVDDPSFVSYLKLTNIKLNETYVCKASNTKGAGKDNRIQVGVRPVFTHGSNSEEAVLNSKYGETVKIPCNIKSYLPITIKWFRSGTELRSGSVYSISSDGSELTVKSMNVEMQGKYTCEASLNSDPTVKHAHNTDVKISGLARPEIVPTNRNIQVTKGSKLELNCKTVRGYPKSVTKWFKKTASNYIPLSNTNSEVLIVNKALFTHAGQYKCEVNNGIGTDTATFDVTVSGLPEITVIEAKREVTFDSNVELTCKVDSSPPPSIVWTDEKGSILERTVKPTSEFEFYSQLKLKNVRNSAVYTCEASNKVGPVTANVNITVSSPFEVKKHIQGEIGINYGVKETLQCDIKSSKPMTIRWYKQKSNVKSSRLAVSSSTKYTISGDGTKLTINSMNIDEEGTYTCEASLLSIPTEKVSYSAKVNVVGLTRPEVTYYTTILNGKNFTAICRIKGVPKPIISWQFKPKGSAEFKTIPGTSEELNILELQLKHTGVYRCIAKNDLGETNHDFDVVVEERPIIHNEESTFYGVKGDLIIKVPCNVTGFPEPTIVWKIAGKPLNMGSKYTLKGTTLYINKPAKSDSADFTCEAKNKLGSATKTFVVIIVDNFEDEENLNGDSHDIYAEQDKPKSIKCNLKNVGEGSVRWYIDGMLSKQTGSTYTIEKVSIAEERNYTCRVNTDEGSESETFALHVGFLPIFDDTSPSPVTIDWKNENQMLDCTADSYPHPKYEWSHNGRPVTGNDFKQVTDWGEYTCTVSNVLGNIQKTFKVISSGCYVTKHIATQNQPLVSDKDKPMLPVSIGNNGVLLRANEEIKLSCSKNLKSVNTFNAIPSKKEVIAKCIAQDKFTVVGKTYRYSELQCNNKVEPSVLGTQKQCSGSKSEIMKVGFEVNGFLEAYKVCYDKKLNVPLYASASADILSKSDGVRLTNFKWSTAPELGNQKIGNWRPEGSCKCCYTQGQLVNVNELAFGPAQDATFKHNLNSIPIWNPCGDSSRKSWQAFDNESRESVLQEKWSSWTGASEYVPKDGGLVPRYIWKVLKTDEGFAVMVYVNDNTPVDSDVRCSSTSCVDSQVFEVDKFLYCCTLDEFGNKFGVPLDTFKAAL